MEGSKYSFYKKNKDAKVWWLDNYEEVGVFVFSFDKKKTYNLFKDYPMELSVEEWETFNKENPYWEEFFADRNAEYEIEHQKEIEKYLRDK